MNAPYAKVNMHGKVCLVTGATHGIGREIALGLAHLGAQVVIHGRNPSLTAQTQAEIQAAAGSSNIETALADFSDLEQVRQMAIDLKDRFSRLDVLVNNAGTFFLIRQMTVGNVEKTLLVNHLAPFLLTQILLDLVGASDEGRIINVSSASHYSARLDLENLALRPIFNPMRAYANSKLANVLFTYELNRRLDGSRTAANAVHPGLVATHIWRSGFKPLDDVYQAFMRRTALSPEQGADTPLYLACSEQVSGLSGLYFDKRQAVPSSPQSYDCQLASRLWELSAQITGLN